MKPVRVALIGAGPMGRLHARAVWRRAQQHGDCRLVCVTDHHPSRTAGLVEEFGGRGVDDPIACLDELDAAIVAVPTVGHAEVAGRMLQHGLDVLIEKPLARTLPEAEALVDLAAARQRVLQVGHVEWYHPVWRAAVLRAGALERIEVDRLNPDTGRGLDIDVVQDFMLHDLDWVRRWVGGEIAHIEAEGRALGDAGWDEAEARLAFASGCVARLRASRVHPSRERRVRLRGRHGSVEADLSSGRVVGGRGGEGIDGVAVAEGEPLDLQWAAFVSACVSRKAPENDAAVGLETMRLVERVRAAIALGEGRSTRDDDPALGG